MHPGKTQQLRLKEGKETMDMFITCVEKKKQRERCSRALCVTQKC